MRVIRKIGNQEWNRLTDEEKLDHLAFDYHRQRQIQAIIDGLSAERPKPSAEALKAITTTNSWEPGAAATLMLGLVE